MFSYYGSKSKIVDLYPSPKFGKIIEPFAGSARYSLKYYDRDILLIDKYPVIVDVWHYLQQASEKDILGLPKIQKGEKTTDYKLSDIEKKFMGFLVQGGQGQPRISTGTLEGINVERDLKNIAKQLYKIRHWKIICQDYRDIENLEAVWFIDPPYQFGGEYQYKFGNKQIDYPELSKWCQARQGQIIVCENTKATWMQFYPMRPMRGTILTTTEAIWSNYPHDFQARQLEML